MAAGPDLLEPPAGLARDTTGAWVSEGAAPFRLDAEARRGRWTEIAVSFVTDADAARPCLLVRRSGDALPRPVPFPMRRLARGEARYVGFLPPDLEGLWFEPLDGPGRFRILSVAIGEPSDLALVGRALRRDPKGALAALGWRILGKRMRSRYRLEAILRRATASSYRRWLAEHDDPSEAERLFMAERVATWAEPPTISVVMPVYDPKPHELEAAIASVRAQIYPHWELCIADDRSPNPAIRPILEAAAAGDPRIRVAFRPENGNIAAASNTALDLATGAVTALLDHDDLLAPHALFHVAREFVDRPGTDIVYSDEDKVDEGTTRYDPHFKPDWNEELFLAQNYLNHLTAVRTSILREIGGFRVGLEGSQDHDLLFRALDRTRPGGVRHVARVLYHWRNYGTSASFSTRTLEKAVAARQTALADLAARRGIRAAVEEGAYGFNRLRRALPDPAPRVAVIVPTRDAAALVRTVARGVLEETEYPSVELVIADNGSTEPETLALFEDLRRDPRVRILAAPGPFNFSAINNRAVAATDAPLLCFLNNDIEVTEPGWLAEMVALCLADRVGAVGAKLLYPDGHVQHAGIVLGIGAPGGIAVAGHAQIGARRDAPGYFGRLAIAHDVSAVTAACMVVRREAFEAVGGFDAVDLAVAFNDVDLCLKLGRAGWRTVWTPYATLTHHESATRGSDEVPEKRDRFRREVLTMVERWSPLLRRDPLYNPNFSLVSAHFTLAGMTPRALPDIKPMFRPPPE